MELMGMTREIQNITFSQTSNPDYQNIFSRNHNHFNINNIGMGFFKNVQTYFILELFIILIQRKKNFTDFSLLFRNYDFLKYLIISKR